MNKVTLLINGVSLPYHVLDKGVQYAKTSGLPVKAVFIYENTDEKDYELPAEAKITNADISEYRAASNLEDLVQHNSSYAETFFQENNVPHEIVVLKNPAIDDISDSLKNADRIFLDHETFTHPDEFAYVNFAFEDLEEQIAGKIEWCKRPK
jgi:hypothetical protein